jgi:putative DNA primase/helicase
MATLTVFLSLLERVRRCSGGWTAKCPAHDDGHNSLSVSEAAGKVLVYCHAGCSIGKVLASLNLTPRDLFDSSLGRAYRNSDGRRMCYDYKSESGELLYQVLRDKNKSFKQRRPDGKGGWKYKLNGVRRVAYLLPELLASDLSDTVFIVEGEKDADQLASKGLVATTNSGGAGKWSSDPKYNAPFRSRQVVILPDNDEVGRNHAEAVAEILVGLAASVKIVSLGHLPEHGDVSDWLAQGRTVEELTRLAAEAPAWTPVSEVAHDGTRSDSPEEEIDPLDWSLEPLRTFIRDSAAGQLEAALSTFAHRWATLDPLKRELARDSAVKIMKGCSYSSPVRLIDAALPAIKPYVNDAKALDLLEPEPWSETVDGATLLDEITATIGRFISSTAEVNQTVALWVLYSHCFEVFDVSPLLAITSPVKRCGKSTLLDLLWALVPRPLSTSNITVSALFRTVEKYRPVLLIDEADSFIRDNEELRGVLNSGHRKGTAYVIRTTGDEHEPQRFTTWCPKAVALIGALPDTLEDRALKLRLKRKPAIEEKERLRFDRLGEFEHLRRRAARWAADMKERLQTCDPILPSEIANDRARDNWRPLLAIADAAGADWPRLAREASRVEAGHEPDSEAPGILLLRDLHALFKDHERMSSENIVSALIEIESRPWGEWKNGKPLSKIGLSNLLRLFGIKPLKWREQDETERGYVKEDFADVFARYIPSDSPQSPRSPEPMI